MRKSRVRLPLALRMSAMLVLLLLVFTLLLGLLYNTLMRRQMIRHYSQSMQRDAHAIAQNLSELVAPSGHEMLDETRFIVGEDTLTPYLSMVELLTDCNVYLVDANHYVIGYFSGVVQTLENPLLPAYLEQTIALGFMGKTPSIQAEYNGDLHLTAAMPVMNEQSRVLGVVMLESTLREQGYAQVPSSTILITSCIIAFGLSMILSLFVSGVFTRPITQVEQVAHLLADGHYQTRLPVRRGDEVGLLAGSMNVLAERLEEARQLEEQQREQQKQLFANISHELRTPVTVIRGSLEALRDGVVKDEKEISAYYEQMIRESRWLQRLIRDLLELSRLQNREFVLESQTFDLCDLLGDVAMSARALSENKGVTFTCEEPRSSYSFTGDYTRLRQMLLAVADNAVKFTPAGRRVQIWLEEDRPVIVIRDEGEGIEAEELKHIFERFRATREPGRDSTGLGLAIVHEIARRHQVEIRVESKVGEGTTFTFVFPLSRNALY